MSLLYQLSYSPMMLEEAGLEPATYGSLSEEILICATVDPPERWNAPRREEAVSDDWVSPIALSW